MQVRAISAADCCDLINCALHEAMTVTAWVKSSSDVVRECSAATSGRLPIREHTQCIGNCAIPGLWTGMRPI